MKTITLPDGREITYELTRKRVRNINFRAKENGIVAVSANSRVSVREIEEFLIQRADFFFRAFERLKKRAETSEINETITPDAQSVRWLGRDFPVRVIPSSRECAVIDEDEVRVFTRRDDAEYLTALIKTARERRFCALCGELDSEVRSALEKRGFTPPPTVITIKDMKSRWGSCSYTRGHISLNIRLAAYPRQTVLSVLWHEYAHYWHHDHSERFYAFLLEMFPEYRKWNDLLKE